MVKLNRIYTRTGDDGSTGLGTGRRVSKASPRVIAYGETDEANAAVGAAVVAADAGRGPAAARIAAVLRLVQHDLFDLGADLCVPPAAVEPAGSALRVTRAQADRLEPIIDEFNAPLAPLTSFVLPGGTALSAALHVARTVVRRAERAAVALSESEPGLVNPEAVRYLNRLSDLLFVLARAANHPAPGDVLWKPGATRGAGDPAGPPSR